MEVLPTYIESNYLIRLGSFIIAAILNANIADAFFIDVFFEHRWYNRHPNKDIKALIQAWNASLITLNVLA